MVKAESSPPKDSNAAKQQITEAIEELPEESKKAVVIEENSLAIVSSLGDMAETERNA